MIFSLRMLRFILPSGALLLGGCDTIMGWANSVGDHMPVIGQRCENWQCFTSSGQTQSEMNQQREQSPRSFAAPPPAAAQPPAQDATDPQGAEKPSVSPYDMSPEQLRNLPPPQVP